MDGIDARAPSSRSSGTEEEDGDRDTPPLSPREAEVRTHPLSNNTALRVGSRRADDKQAIFRYQGIIRVNELVSKLREQKDIGEYFVLIVEKTKLVRKQKSKDHAENRPITKMGQLKQRRIGNYLLILLQD